MNGVNCLVNGVNFLVSGVNGVNCLVNSVNVMPCSKCQFGGEGGGTGINLFMFCTDICLDMTFIVYEVICMVDWENTKNRLKLVNPLLPNFVWWYIMSCNVTKSVEFCFQGQDQRVQIFVMGGGGGARVIYGGYSVLKSILPRTLGVFRMKTQTCSTQCPGPMAPWDSWSLQSWRSSGPRSTCALSTNLCTPTRTFYASLRRRQRRRRTMSLWRAWFTPWMRQSSWQPTWQTTQNQKR